MYSTRSTTYSPRAMRQCKEEVPLLTTPQQPSPVKHESHFPVLPSKVALYYMILIASWSSAMWHCHEGVTLPNVAQQFGSMMKDFYGLVLPDIVAVY